MLNIDAVLGHSRAEHEDGQACFAFVKTSYTSTGELVLLPHLKTLGQPCALWSHPPDSSQSIPLVTSAFFLPWGTNTNKYVGLFLIFPFDLEVLKTSTRHLTLHGRLPTAARNNIVSCGGGGGNLFIPKSIFLHSLNIPLIHFFLPCLWWHSILIFILSTNTFFF